MRMESRGQTWKNSTNLNLSLKLDVCTIQKISTVREELALNQNSQPHITLYMTFFHKNKISALINALREGFANPEFEFSFGSIQSSSRGYLLLEIEESENIVGLHRKALEIMTPFFAPEHCPPKEYVKDHFPERLNLLESHGSIWVYPYFKPHITLAYQHSKASLEQPLVPPPFTGQVEGVKLSVASRTGALLDTIWSSR